MLAEPFPGDKEGRTFAEVIASRVATVAARGDVRAAAELADRTEGRIRRSDESPLPLVAAETGVVALVSQDPYEQLRELTARLRERINARRLNLPPANVSS